MKIYCPTCGKSSEEIPFIGEFCYECVTKKIKEEMPETETVYTCRFCERMNVLGQYKKASKESLAEELTSLLKKHVTVIDFDKKKASLNVVCTVDGNKAKFRYDINLKWKFKTCQQCDRKKSGYFEAVIQLRGDKFLIKQMLYSIEGFVNANGAFVTKKEDINEGYDVYISDKKVANEFFAAYKLKPKRSYTLHGMKKGKELYRNFYLLRL
jgi:NMD protein affecting ribosome stability and mRNA decay